MEQLFALPKRNLPVLFLGALLNVNTAVFGTGCIPNRESPAPRNGTHLLTEISKPSGIKFDHAEGTEPVDLEEYFFPDVMGPGGALFDYDQDGDLDVYLVNGSRNGASGNRLFRQEASGRFTDVSDSSGLADPGFGMGAAVGDINNDGYPDVYVTNYRADRLYLNLRNGVFRDITKEAGIDNVSWSASACFFDYDRDGWLDLYVTNYVDYYPSKTCSDARGWQDFCGPQVFNGVADKLYRNTTGASGEQRDNEPDTERDDQSAKRVRFEDRSLLTGVAQRPAPGLGVIAADFTRDGWPDLFVANDGAANFLWVNRRDGTFTEQGILRGCAYDERGAAQGSMGIALGDVNGDGEDDIFLTHLAGENNALYLGLGKEQAADGGFHDRVSAAGLGKPSFAFTGFGTVMADLDHDGDLDVLIANGRVKRPPESSLARSEFKSSTNRSGSHTQKSVAGFWRTYAEPNQIFLNDGEGDFRETKVPSGARVSANPSAAFTTVQEVSRGLAAGDIDNDGDLDFLVTNTGGPARLYRNETISKDDVNSKDNNSKNTWLVVRAVLPRYGGRDAYGAVITVVAGDKRWRRSVQVCSSYLCSNDPRVHFGLAGATQIDRIEVQWPDGTHETYPGGSTNQIRVLQQQSGGAGTTNRSGRIDPSVRSDRYVHEKK